MRRPSSGSASPSRASRSASCGVTLCPEATPASPSADASRPPCCAWARMLFARRNAWTRLSPSSVPSVSCSASARLTSAARKSPPVALTQASITSCRTPRSRRCTRRRSTKKARRSAAGCACAPPSIPCCASPDAIAASRSSRKPPSRTIRITPRAARRSANGSFDPVGFSSMLQKPASMSILSASATAADTGAVGAASVGPRGA